MTQPVATPNRVSEETHNEAEILRYCLYARKSTEEDEKQALSIDSQINEMTQLAEKENLNIVEVRQESHSAKASGQRQVFNKLVEDIRGGVFNAILTWAPDRLSRNAGDLGKLVDLMDQGILREIRTYGQQFTDSPNEKFLLMILGSQAKLENDNKSENVKRGLRARCEQGLWPSVAPIGYLNDKRQDRPGHILVDSERAPIIKKIFEKVGNEGWSGRDVYRWLKNDVGFKTRNGKHLSLSRIYRTLQKTFYYGVFEYPKGSGDWYTGKHKPIISKELFERVQEQLAENTATKGMTYNKEFAFTKLMKCGLCGSGITAMEKFKNLKGGGQNRYVYYGCTRSKDKGCENRYIREKDLIVELQKIIDEIDLDELGMKEQLEKEVERYHKFREGVMGLEKEKASQEREVDMRNYAKYILEEGSIYEKRELLVCLNSRLVLESKNLQVLDI